MFRTDRTLALLATATAVTALGGCFLTGGSTPSTPSNQTGVTLEFNNAFDQPGDDWGGGKQMEDIPITWEGLRDGAEGQGPGDYFSKADSKYTIATDPWYANTIVAGLNPGAWKFAVTVNGQPFACPTSIDVPTGKTINVTFQIDKTSGQFTGCTHN